MRTIRRMHRLTDRTGIALPLALAALLALSLLLGAAMVMATVEMSTSRAHREGVGALLHAERAVERLLAAAPGSGGAATPLAPGVVDLKLEGAPGASRLRISRLARSRRLIAEDSLRRTETFALVAEPLSKGRRIGALATSTRSAPLPPLGIGAAVISGGAVRLIGAASTLVESSPACGADSAGLAVILPDGESLETQAGAAMPAAVERHALSGQLLERVVLGGATLAELASWATLRLGGTGPIAGVNTSHGASNADSLYNWGCPPTLGVMCVSADTARIPVVVLDAGGGTVRVSGDYGQGVLLVLGALEISGPFRFAGLVAAEGGVRVLPGSVARIDGALLALGAAGVEVAGADVRFDRCALRRARIALADGSLPWRDPRIERGSFGWFEVTY